MSLIKILNGEPLPRPPVDVGPEIDKYIRDLHNYLQRLWSAFTGTNIKITVDEEGAGTSSDKYEDVWLEVSGTGSVVVSNKDWRGGYIATRDGFTWSNTPTLNEVMWEAPSYTDDFAGIILAGDYEIRKASPGVGKLYSDPAPGTATANVLLTLKGGTGKLVAECTAFSGAGKTLKIRYFLWGSPRKSSPTHTIG